MRLFRLASITALIILTLTLNLANAVPGAHANGDDDQARPIPEKREFTYPNLGSHLDQLATRVEGGEATAEEAAGEASIHREESVAVTIHLSGNVDDVVAFLEENGGDPRNVGEDYIEAYVPVSLLGPVSERPGVIRVREIIPPQPEFGPITSQGVQAHGSAAWNSAGYTGQDVKVGILDSFEGFQDLMGTELPSTVAARCYTDIGGPTQNLADCDSGSAHGTGVAEAIVDVAPEVSLYISNPRSPADLSNTVRWMAEQGVTVINRSASRAFEGPGDGTSPYSESIFESINHAVDNGIVWVNSAGNYATETWFRSSPVIHTVTFITLLSVDFVAFDGIDDTTNGMLGVGEEVRVILRWDDRWGGASSDMDLLLWDTIRGEYVASSEDYQTGQPRDIPFEAVTHELVEGRLYEIDVVHSGGTVPDWVQVTVRGPVAEIEHYTENGSLNNASESANSGMLAVGASHYWDTNTIADYSSRGPTPDGREKPDIVGTACAEAASYEPRPPEFYDGNTCWFPGTSQAAPHVAGMAALVRQRFPDMGPVEVAEYLKGHAVQREEPDPNNTWGHGFAALPLVVLCSDNAGLMADCAALLAARDTLAGTGTLNWSADVPVTEWDGVMVGGSPWRVTELQLPDKGLSGEIPAGLGSLANLEILYLGDNQLTGTIPVELGQLANLTILALGGNQLSGTIPTWLGSLVNLEGLYLWGNELSGEIPVELGQLANLTILDLQRNQLTGDIPAQLGSLANLEEMYLWGNELSGEIPAELGSLASLEILALGGNQLSGEIPAQLASLTSLEILTLGGNQLTGPIPVWLGTFTNLERLWLYENQFSGTIPTQLGNLTNLEQLSLSENQLSGEIPAELGSLASLKELYLWGNGLTGTIPAELGSLARLERLSVSENQLSGEIPAELGNLSNLEELWLSENQLSGEIPAELGSLSNLRRLSLWENQLSGTIPAELGSLANLRRLSLWENQLSGEIPAELGNLTNLEQLSLSENQLSGAIPPELGGLDNLEILALGGNQLTGTIPAELGSLSNLRRLSLWENQLSGEIPAELGSLSNLRRLSLWENQLSGEIPAELGNLSNLEELWLSENQLSGEIPAELGSLAKLKDLTLPQNQLSGEIPPELGSLANLERLWLHNNQLTGAIPAELGSLSNLQDLRLSGNQLSGEIPSELGGLVNLTVLYLSGNELTGCVPDSWRDVEDNDLDQLGLSFCPPEDPQAALIRRYDTNMNGRIDRGEVIQGINDYLFGPPGFTTRAQVIQLINLYLFG